MTVTISDFANKEIPMETDIHLDRGIKNVWNMIAFLCSPMVVLPIALFALLISLFTCLITGVVAALLYIAIV